MTDWCRSCGSRENRFGSRCLCDLPLATGELLELFEHGGQLVNKCFVETLTLRPFLMSPKLWYSSSQNPDVYVIPHSVWKNRRRIESFSKIKDLDKAVVGSPEYNALMFELECFLETK